MTIRSRLERIEAKVTPPPKWSFHAEGLDPAYGPLGEGEAEFLNSLTLAEADKLDEILYRMPILQLRELTRDLAIARYIAKCRTALASPELLAAVGLDCSGRYAPIEADPPAS